MIVNLGFHMPGRGNVATMRRNGPRVSMVWCKKRHRRIRHGKPITVSQDAAVSGFATFRSYGVIECRDRKFRSCDLRIGRNIPHAVEDERAFLEETTRRCLGLIFTFESINLFLFPSQHSIVHSIKRMHYVLETKRT